MPLADKNKPWNADGMRFGSRREKGAYYEALAARFLERQGYVLIEQNFRCRFGEIDLIAKDHGVLCFIEVKYRRDSACGFPSEAVGAKKQRRIIKSARYYLSACRAAETPVRFDIAEILGGRIRVIKDAFGFSF